MKYMVGCVVWNKVDMISWLLQGISLAFPKGTHVVFYFDGCVDDSEAAFRAMTTYWIDSKGYTFEVISVPATKREVGGHVALQHRFMETDCDCLVVIQDDQHLNGPLVGLEETYAKHGDKMGVITGRDAYNGFYTNFVGSQWTLSAVHRKLAHGEFAPRPYMNSGPVIYNKRLIEKVGFLDTNYWAFYVWDDYGARAHKLGFVNGALGTDLDHLKFGRQTNSTFYTKEISMRDSTRLRQLHAGII